MKIDPRHPRAAELKARAKQVWKIWYSKNRAKELARHAIYKSKHKERLRLQRAAQKKADPLRISEINKRSKKKNKAKILARQRYRYANEPNYRISRLIRCGIWRMVKFKWKKKGRCREYIGCTFDELRRHLESQFKPGMTWSNHGEWEIDHIKPLVAFNLTDDLQARAAWHFSNLQPLWKHENRTKQGTFVA